MIATEDAPKTVFQTLGPVFKIVLVVLTLFGTLATGFFYKRYADVWLRSPPRMPACVLITRRLLSHEESVSGSIPHMTPDGNMIYLRPAEDRAVQCMGRLSSSAASLLAAAFAEVDPDKRARALVAIPGQQISANPSADPEALAAYLITSAALRPLPKTDDLENLRSHLNTHNACRFAMRTPCPSRPPIPMPVWMFGVPSFVGLVVSFGWGGQAIAIRVRDWLEKRRLAKKPPTKNAKDVKSKKTKKSSKAESTATNAPQEAFEPVEKTDKPGES
ncbi:MAG TPA: hypothetical protein PK156_12005 [Polyangium sp.]|nr:hypothetical protein [Polyangium sp.]